MAAAPDLTLLDTFLREGVSRDPRALARALDALGEFTDPDVEATRVNLAELARTADHVLIVSDGTDESQETVEHAEKEGGHWITVSGRPVFVTDAHTRFPKTTKELATAALKAMPYLESLEVRRAEVGRAGAYYYAAGKFKKSGRTFITAGIYTARVGHLQWNRWMDSLREVVEQVRQRKDYVEEEGRWETIEGVLMYMPDVDQFLDAGDVHIQGPLKKVGSVEPFKHCNECTGGLAGWCKKNEKCADKVAKLAEGTSLEQTLYVSRRVLNAEAIIAWAKEQGFDTCLPPEDMHVTVCYSKEPVIWQDCVHHLGPLEVAGGERKVIPLGDDGAVVLRFSSAALAQEHQDFLNAGASWDYEEYHPHITLTYDPPEGLDLASVQPYAGPIQLGEEVYAEIERGWADDIKEGAFNPDQPRDEQGRWTAGGGHGEIGGKTPRLGTDNPGGDWLEGERRRSQENGLGEAGAPRTFGSVTGFFSDHVLIPVSKLEVVPGLRNEQLHVRQNDLESLKGYMAEHGQLPPAGHGLGEYAPFLQVDSTGRAWMNEGNHRVMAARDLGWQYLPVEVRYFAGGERVPGVWHPDTLLARDKELRGTRRYAQDEVREFYNPDEPRDDHGRWTGGSTGGGTQVFHGTVDSYVESIKREGLKLKPDMRNFSARFYEGERGEGVYVSTDKELALHFAKEAAFRAWDKGISKEGKEPVVRPQAVLLRIRIPKEEAGKMKLDNVLGGTSRRVPFAIKPEWIERVVNVKSKAHYTEGEDLVLYAVVVCDGGEAKQHAEGDTGGRWITIQGRHILIKEGETIKQAFFREAERHVGNEEFMERVIVLDEDGHTVLEKVGEKDRVEITPGEAKDIRGGTFIHNHPDDVSFSVSDLTCAQQLNLKEVVAVGKTWTYRMGRDGEAWPANFQSRIGEEMRAAGSKLAVSAMPHGVVLMKGVDVAWTTAWDAMMHEAATVIAADPKSGLHYSREKTRG